MEPENNLNTAYGQADVPSQEPGISAQPPSPWTLGLKAALAIGLACLVVYQTVVMVKAMRKPRPVRIGTYLTNKQADAAINDLWLISQKLQQGSLVTEASKAFSSGNAYVLKKGQYKYMLKQEGTDVVAYSMSTADYRLAELKVSREKPVPVAK